MPMHFPRDVYELMRERDRAFEQDDYNWVWEFMTRKGMKIKDANQFLMAFHKARYELFTISSKKRYESQRWLVEHGVKRMNGEYAKLGDPLPSAEEYKRLRLKNEKRP